MQTLIFAASIVALMYGLSVNAAQTSPDVYKVNGKESTKVEALKALLANPSADVTRCQALMVTEKATLKKRTAAK